LENELRWITTLTLQTWAETLGARNIFPGMVADLIRASAQDISTIRFPNGDKGQVRGFDGVLEATGVPPYVPDGESIWEFGVSADAATKANSDFDKRTAEVDEAKRMRTTFVFVTPRTWNNGKEKLADWVDEKKKLGKWKDVIYLDGSMVEDWLSRSPAVAARYARFELKLMPAIGVRSTDEFWEEYSSRFGPQLVEQVLLAGREEQAEALIQRLSEGVSKLSYAADAPDEVVAFAVAAIRRSEPSVRYFLEARTLVVDTEEAARQIAGVSGLTFLPRAQARGLAGYLAQIGPTVVSAGADDKKHGHEVLRRPSSTELGKALSEMGFTEQEGYDLARRCGRSLAVLARLRPSGTAPKPEWLGSGAQLLPALLAGAWHVPTKPDQEILCHLAGGHDYPTCETPLRALSKLQDPPIDFVKDVWALRASVDAFVHLGHLIGAEHLARFSEAAKTVFGKTVEPPKADEVFKPAAERAADTHSRWLRDGMMNTLLHMAVLHEQADFAVTGTTPQEYVNSVVRGLPGLSSDHRLLASLQDQIALLAEAAPIPFVEALERLLEGDAAGIRPIFEEHKGFISSHSYHYGVLWGLELLAWDPKLLLRVALCLARLAEIDPGGSDSNRPINSLRSIFLSWAPNTSATAKHRMGVLARVLESVPSVAWQLITKLLPTAHDVSSPTQKPAFREFGDAVAEVLTYGVVWESQAFVIEMAIRHAGLKAERWVELINAIGDFPKQSFDGTAKALEAVLASTAADVRFVIWDALRKEVNRHRTYVDTDWALPADDLSQLDLLVQSFSPADAIARSTWLFDDWLPDVPGKVQEDGDPEEVINTARLHAIRDVVQESGTQGLIELAKKVKLPQHVGYAARGLELDFDALCQFFGQALHAGPELDVFTSAILAEGVSRFGTKWMEFAVNRLSVEHATPARIAGLLMVLDESAATWAYVKEYGDAVNEMYWRGKHSSFISGNADELMFAIDNYIARNRPLAALDSASRRIRELPTSLLIRLLDESVQEINGAGRTARAVSVYNVERAFDELRTREDVAPDAVAALEFRYLPVFYRRKKPLVLHTLMMQQPKLFMDTICAVFKRANRTSESPAEGAEKLAVAAYDLLTSIRLIPGQRDDDVDEQALLAWCTEVRRIAVEVDRENITDQRLGALLAHAPSSKNDNAWPHESVRSAIEKLASDEVERGLSIERFNMRGVYGKAIGEGGDQERALAAQYREWANAMPGWPRAAAMLMQISESWLRDAERADLSAQQEALRW
jgi:hypothetical protein